MSTPTVSVIIPAFQAAGTIRATLAALATPSAGTPPFEVIVVDNGSSDETVEIATSAGVRVEHCSVRGAAAARNVGLSVARGRFIAFTDADCVPAADWLLRGTGALLEDDTAAIVAGEIVGTRPTTRVQAWMNRRRILDPRPPLQHPFLPFAQTANAFFRADDLRRVSGFDRTLPSGEDCDLCWRVLESGSGRLVFDPSVRIQHDHRATILGVARQAAHNASADARLALKWGPAFGRKSFGRSLWELREVVRLAFIALRSLARDARARSDALCDLALGAGRKWGMIRTAAQTGVWNRW